MPNTAKLNSTPATSIIDTLYAMKVLSEEQANKAKMIQIQGGLSEEQVLLENNLATEDNILKAKSAVYNIPLADLNSTPISPEALSVLPQEVAERFLVFPINIDKQNKVLNLAMSDPMNLNSIEFIEKKTGFRVKPFAAGKAIINELIATKYKSTLSVEVSAALKDVTPQKPEGQSLVNKIGFVREEKISEIVSHILEFAVKSRSSDIHIEPQEKSTRVRYRIDGILQEKLTIPKELHDSLISRIKILSDMKIDEKRVPQDGRFNFKTNDEDTDLRVSSLPTTWGEKIVMRLLKKTKGVPDLPELGLRGKAVKNLQDAILRPHGIILICGPTGSGKTTTLYSIISRINTPKVNIVTLEDPIEYKIAGVNQVQVNPIAGLTFASGLKAFLRQDPNVILVGEIRDQETADLAVQASLTGHLVFSTLHTNDASGALPRLLDMGAEPYLLASSITAVVAQRVVRKIHDDCKESYIPDPEVGKNIKDVLGPLFPQDQELKFYKGKGCEACENSGYYGRIGIYEVLPITDAIAKLILERSPASAIDQKAREEGMITLKQDGYLKVIAGLTTIEEVLRVAQE